MPFSLAAIICLDTQMKEMEYGYGRIYAAMNHDTHAGHDSMSITPRIEWEGLASRDNVSDEHALGRLQLSLACTSKHSDLHYRFDASLNRIVLQSERALKQFETEQQQVEDVLNSKGMTPQIAADGTKEFTLTAELHDWSLSKACLRQLGPLMAR